MPRIIQPVVSPRGRVIVLTGATLWLIAAIVLSALPDGAGADTRGGLRATPAVAPSETRILHSIEKLDGIPGLLFYPRVAVDAQGRVYVADEGAHRVVRLADDLRTAELVFGREGAGPGELRVPYDVAVDSHGNVFVADWELRRINKYAADSTFIRSIAAPAASLLVDSQDRLIVYPAPGTALLQRYDNDLQESEGLLEKTDAVRQQKSKAVLTAIGPRDRLYILDQTVSKVSIYDSEMRLEKQFDVNPPRLRESIEAHVAAMQAKLPEGGIAHWNGIQSMSLDPSGEWLAFSYLIMDAPGVKHSRIAWYHTDGTYSGVDERNERVLSTAMLSDGRILEGDAERLRLVVRPEQKTLTTTGNNN